MTAGFNIDSLAQLKTQVSADHPITFANTIGLYRPGDNHLSSNTAVLFISSWGFEELCARKFWQHLAVELSKYGLPSLRFDYPGTGDSLDHPYYAAGVDVWLDTINVAAQTVKELSGAQQILLICHGIGAVLGWKVAETIAGISGIALAAPALSGRHWLREFVAMSRIANQGAIQHSLPSSGPSMGEQMIPEQVAEGIKSLNISTPDVTPTKNILLLRQENRAADEAFATHLQTLGINVQSYIFKGYDLFIRDVMFSVPPTDAIETLTKWAREISAQQPTKEPIGRMTTVPQPIPLAGDGFMETPVRFGDNNRLFGVLSEPVGPRRGATVLVMSTGYDRMSGWGRITARLCRDLAKSGIPALRFDMASVADSPSVDGRPKQIFYSDIPLADIDAAMAFIEQQKLFPVVATGRCSGGWLAFRSGVKDKRLSAVVPVNVFDFYIAPDMDIEALLISSRQPLASYGAKLMSGGFWRKVLRGDVRIRNGVVNMWAMVVGKAISFLTPVMVRFPFLSRRFHTLSQDFKTIAANDTRISIVYTEGDVGAAMLETNFGSRGRLLTSRYGNPRLVFIPDADHNLTTANARNAWTEEVKAIAMKFPPQV